MYVWPSVLYPMTATNRSPRVTFLESETIPFISISPSSLFRGSMPSPIWLRRTFINTCLLWGFTDQMTDSFRFKCFIGFRILPLHDPASRDTCLYSSIGQNLQGFSQ